VSAGRRSRGAMMRASGRRWAIPTRL